VPTHNQTKLDDLSSEHRARFEALRARRQAPEQQADLVRVRPQFADHPSREELVRRGHIDPERTLNAEARLA
jgi:hypothetical protein